MLQLAFLLVPFAAGLALLLWSLRLIRAKAKPSFNRDIIKIGSNFFKVALADTLNKRLEGLSGLVSMVADEGMLFTFPVARKYVFWMQGMKFPLDILWIKDGQVVDISVNVPVGAGQIVRPKTAADAVLEVNAGTAQKLNIQIGDKIEFVSKD